MSSGERILFLDNSFKMCHCLSMSVMDKNVMQNEMTIFFFNGFTLSPHTYKGKLFKHSRLYIIHEWQYPAGTDGTDVVRSCYDQVLSEFLDYHTRNHRCQHLIVKFHKNSQSRSSAIYATLDLWLYTRFVGETGCGKEGEGVWERKRSK